MEAAAAVDLCQHDIASLRFLMLMVFAHSVRERERERERERLFFLLEEKKKKKEMKKQEIKSVLSNKEQSLGVSVSKEQIQHLFSLSR